jgi:23S rRNA pseudouridine2605 synthase
MDSFSFIFTGPSPFQDMSAEETVRLQKFLASAGIASRREAETLIESGKVYVNGRKAALGQKIDPLNDRVTYKGDVITAEEKISMLFYKPRGFLCNDDGRREGETIFHEFPELLSYKVVIGLEKAASGLILLSNDGDLLQGVARQYRALERTFHLRVKGNMQEDAIERLTKGFNVEDRHLKLIKLKELKKEGERTWYECSLCDHRDMVLEKAFKMMGHPIQRIVQVGVAGLRDDLLKKGKGRLLTAKETKQLAQFVGGSS